MRLVERERVQNIGEKKLLMLLLVIETDFDNGGDFFKIFRGSDQRVHRVVNVRSIFGDLGNSGPSNETALRTKLPRTGGDVIGIEEITESVVEHLIGLRKRAQQKLLEEPGHVRSMPFCRTRIRHRLHDLIFRVEVRSTPFGFFAHCPIGLEPRLPPVGGHLLRSRSNRLCGIRQSPTSYPNTR